jgi:hypothetical protein
MRDPMYILRNLANSPWYDNDTIKDALLTGKEFTYEEVKAVARKSVEIWLNKRSTAWTRSSNIRR